MPAHQQSIRSFMRKRCIPNDKALAAWIQKVGAKTASKDSGLPEAKLAGIVQTHFPSGASCHLSPTQFGLGCVVEDSDREVFTQAAGAEADDVLSIDSLGISDDAHLPQEHWINVPKIDSSTDQGSIGSCVSWSGAHLMDNAVGNADNNSAYKANPSAIYGFIKGHGLDPWPNEHGSTMEALAGALYRFGAPSWESMPVYREAPSGNPANLPHPKEAVVEAKQNRIQKPRWIRDWNDDSLYKAMCLMHGDTEKYPGRQFVIATAFYVPDSLFNAYTAETGIVMMPPADDAIVGGHAVAFIGWKEINGERYFIVKNSWGMDFGDDGYLYFPEAFVKAYFKKSFIAPELLREPQTEDGDEDQKKRTPLAEAVAVGSSVIAAFLIVGLVTVLVGIVPSLLTGGSSEAAPAGMTTATTDSTTEPEAAETPEQMSTPQEQNVLEIYARTLRLIDQND